MSNEFGIQNHYIGGGPLARELRTPGNLRLNEVINELKFRQRGTPVVCRRSIV